MILLDPKSEKIRSDRIRIGFTPLAYTVQNNTSRSTIKITQYKNMYTEKLHNANYMQACDYMFIPNMLTGLLSI